MRARFPEPGAAQDATGLNAQHPPLFIPPPPLLTHAYGQSLAGLRPAITAMGGVVDLVNVSSLGVVEIRFRGTNKVQYGLELAVRDIPMVKHVKFVE